MTTSNTKSTLVFKYLCSLFVAICVTASNVAVASTVLINTLNGTTAKAINATPATAQRFTTTTNAYEVDAVALYMQYSGTSIDGQYSVIIYDATGTKGIPGTLIQSIATGNLSSLLTTADTPTLFAVNTSVSLNANQDYWLVLQRQNGTTGTLQWSAWGSPTGGTNTASFLSSFNNAGPSWTTPVANSINSGEYYRMEVTAVPEPSTYAVLASGLTVAAIAANRRRVRNSAQRKTALEPTSLKAETSTALSSHT